MKSDLGSEQSDYQTVQNDTCSSAGGTRETDASTVDTDASRGVSRAVQHSAKLLIM